MAEYVQLEIKIDDKGSFKKVAVKADDLDEAVKRVKKSVDELDGNLVNMAQETQVFQAITTAAERLYSAFKGLTSEYALQQQSEARLAQAMRNTMGASDEEIESIKRLADAQERSGIVAADVQIAAAQELAIYLELSSSLKTIIPVLNDMVAQQLGVGASAESATQIADEFATGSGFPDIQPLP